LQNEADEVAGTEDDCVYTRLEAGEILVVYDDNSGEAQVDLHQKLVSHAQQQAGTKLTDAERSAGAMVRVTRYIRKLLLSKGEL
jgi:hypothetical protein